MNRLTFFGLLLVFVWLVAPIAAQQPVVTAEYSYRRYTTDDGLPTMFAYRLLIDSKGFLWIGSTAGISCFDGEKFTVYMQGEFNNIFGLHESVPGNINFYATSNFYTLNTTTNNISTDLYIDSLDLIMGNLAVTPSNYHIFKDADKKNGFVIYIV